MRIVGLPLFKILVFFPLMLHIVAMKKRYLWISLLLVLPASGCSSLGYYVQATRGHLNMMSKRQDVVELLASSEVDEALKAKLRLTQAARDFAISDLDLPDNQSYRTYADLERSHVVWNVFATPEFSIEPKTWCYWFVGCLAYRGYFAQARAQEEAEALRGQNHDVFVGGVSAYSTLGRFSDPLLNTMFNRPDIYVIELMFHELTHQKVYRAGDSEFSESLASFVQEEGVTRWLNALEDDKGLRDYLAAQQRQNEFAELLIATRQVLQRIYVQKISQDQLRVAKKKAFDDLRQSYAELRQQWNQQWGSYGGYDRWFEQDLNNAHLLSVSTYHRLVPAFRQLLLESNNDMPRFFERCHELAELDQADLDLEMNRLLNAYSNLNSSL